MSRDRRTRSVICADCERKTRHRSGRCLDHRADDLPKVSRVRQYIEIVHRGGVIRLHPDVAVQMADALVDHAEQGS